MFCTVKQTINKTKRQPTEWEKIFASVTLERLKMCVCVCVCGERETRERRKLIQLNIKKNKIVL